ncbi:MAG TPA: hypothetical protein VMT46_07970 [Anaerolineaceae bacterium]|nr:hypothetical protein [Anaerolineaceae bacterium]
MDRPKNGVKIQNLQGKPIQVGAFKVIPESQSISIHFPFGGFVYNRPIAVQVERDGTLDRIPIVDVTRLALLGLAGFSFFFTIVLSMRMGRAARPRRK